MKTLRLPVTVCSYSSLLLAGLTLLLSLAARGQSRPLELGTILPKDVPQEIVLQKLIEDWKKASGGAVTMRLAPSGKNDGEAGIVKKINSGNYQAALLSAVGLAEIEKDVSALQMIPLTFRNWEEVDFTRERLRGQLEAKLLKKGFVVLFWADAGWVNFFSTRKATAPDEFKQMTMFSWVGNAEQVAIMKSLGYKPVEREPVDLVLAFRNKSIEAAPIAPLFAIGLQLQTAANHVLEVNWSPIVGAAIIRKDVWDKFPPERQQAFRKLCDKAGVEIRAVGRRYHDDCLRTLRKGPTTVVHVPTAQEMAQWEELGAQLGPRIRGKIVPAPMYDEVHKILKEYRAAKVVKAP